MVCVQVIIDLYFYGLPLDLEDHRLSLTCIHFHRLPLDLDLIITVLIVEIMIFLSFKYAFST